MLMRIFSKHPSVHTLNEPHFFERYWQGFDQGKRLSVNDSAQLLLKMTSNQRDGFFAKPNESYLQECTNAVLAQDPYGLFPSELYQLFLLRETQLNHRVIPCDKTPQNVFYIHEILNVFPDAIIINMVRDPRSVLASQKNKWKRRGLGSAFMPRKEVLRLRVNYHPIAMCQLWNAAVGATAEFKIHLQVVSLRYEDLLRSPKEVIQKVCAFCKLDFHQEMLDIPVASSSVRPDAPNKRGIHADSLNSWRQHLTSNEIGIVQKYCKSLMESWGYEAVTLESSVWAYLFTVCTYPFKMLLALAFNISRVRSLKEAVLRRISNFSPPKLRSDESRKSQPVRF